MESNSLVPLELINKLINLGHVSREFYCERCEAYTKHVIVSYADDLDSVGGSALMRRYRRIFGQMLDYVPGFPLLLGNMYACTTCGRMDCKGGILS